MNRSSFFLILLLSSCTLPLLGRKKEKIELEITISEFSYFRKLLKIDKKDDPITKLRLYIKSGKVCMNENINLEEKRILMNFIHGQVAQQVKTILEKLSGLISDSEKKKEPEPFYNAKSIIMQLSHNQTNFDYAQRIKEYYEVGKDFMNRPFSRKSKEVFLETLRQLSEMIVAEIGTVFIKIKTPVEQNYPNSLIFGYKDKPVTFDAPFRENSNTILLELIQKIEMLSPQPWITPKNVAIGIGGILLGATSTFIVSKKLYFDPLLKEQKDEK